MNQQWSGFAARPGARSHFSGALLVGWAVLVSIVGLMSVPVAGQSTKTAAAWKAPRTSWGDPDIQGNFTNLWETGTPLERPDQFAGRRLEDIKGQELIDLRKAIQENTTSSSLNEPVRGPREVWLDAFKHEKGSVAWLVVDPPDGKIPPLTPAAQQKRAAIAQARRDSGRGPYDSPEDLGEYQRCISRGLPGSMMPTLYGNSYHIVQSPGFVAIRYEMIHETRIIPLDKRPHLGPGLRSYMGDAVGHWEGDTLVVETRNFKDETAFRGANGATLRLVERFTRVAPDKVKWAVTVDDPTTWTRPWTFSMPLTMDDQEQLFEYACHEANYNMTNMLSGARAEERAAADAARKK